MQIITLTSDWNKYDFYVGTIKGVLLSHVPNAQVIDISHDIDSFNIGQAAYITRNSYKHFPENTIHIIAINTDLAAEKKHLAIKVGGQYFIGPDNGIFSLIFQDIDKEIYTIEATEETNSSFIALTLYAKVAIDIANKKELSSIGTRTKEITEQTLLRPTIEDNSISGSVIYIDSYHNGITNISHELFNRVSQQRNFDIFVKNNRNKINRINKTYSETPVGDLLAIFNSVGLLEIAVNTGDAAQLIGLSINAPILIKFY